MSKIVTYILKKHCLKMLKVTLKKKKLHFTLSVSYYLLFYIFEVIKKIC